MTGVTGAGGRLVEVVRDRRWRMRRAEAWARTWRVLIGDGVMTLTGAGNSKRGQFGGSGLNALRRVLGAMPWEALGERAVLVTLTYPNGKQNREEWRRWVPDARVLAGHRTELLKQWSARWGERPFGLWVLEFQRSGAPHLNLYVRMPKACSDDDFVVLREHTRQAKIGGRGPNGERLGWRAVEGEFGYWLRHGWVDIVGTRSTGDEARHFVAGVDVQTFFAEGYEWSVVDGLKIGVYLAKEIGKRQQKECSTGFEKAQMWRTMGGFGPVVLVEESVDPEVAMELCHLMVTVQVERYGERCRLVRPRRDGTGATLLQEVWESLAMLAEAEQAVYGVRESDRRLALRQSQVLARRRAVAAEGA